MNGVLDWVCTRADFSGFVSGFINFRVFGFVGVYTKRIFGFLTVYQDDNSRNIHDKIINTLFFASTAINKMLPEKSLGVG